MQEFESLSEVITTGLSAPIASIASLTTVADQMIYTTGSDDYAVTTLTAFARSLLDDSTASAARGTLGAQAQGDILDDLNTLGAATADGEFLVATGAGALAWESGATARTSLGLGASDGPTFATVATTATTVASLPAASTAGAGARSFVTDATATTFLSTVAGGGANPVPVVSDGTNWLIG